VSALAAFAEAQELNFGLLSDPDASATRKLGALSERGRYAGRISFVIDDKGVLRHVDREVDVSSHGTDIAALVKKLRGDRTKLSCNRSRAARRSSGRSRRDTCC
jgi:peroxiredoxin